MYLVILALPIGIVTWHCWHLEMMLLIAVLIVLVIYTTSIGNQEVIVNIVEETADVAKVCARQGDKVDISYIALYSLNNNDYEFDRSNLFTFRVGDHKVIAGLEIGIIGTCIGEKRQIKIPPHLGYENHANIPKDAILIFNLYCSDINSIRKNQRWKPMENFFSMLDDNKNGEIEINEFIKWFSTTDLDDHLGIIHFQRADANADGKIDQFEYKSAKNLIKLSTEYSSQSKEL